MLPSVIRVLSRDSNFIVSPLNNYQSVRWRRKPRWLPTAKSKVFRVPQRPVIPTEEHEELKGLHNIYRTEMRSLRKFFLQKTRASETGAEIIAENLKLEDEELQKCLKLNDEWNADVAALRLARIAREKELELENIIKRVEETKLQEEARKREMEALVKLEKEKSKTYITPQNIDAAIEKALSSTVDYDFSIDLEGNKYVGRNTKPGGAEKTPPPPAAAAQQITPQSPP